MSRSSAQPFLLRTALIALVAGLALGAGLTLWLRPPPPPIIITEPAPPPPPPPPPITKPAATYRPVDTASLPGWNADTLSDVRAALTLSCEKIGGDAVVGPEPIARPANAWRAACAEIAAAGDGPDALRAAIDRAFQPFAVSVDGDDRGTFTGYYEASLNGALTRSERYT
ncbi:MAG: MltA domain-containing protein, partial [Rhodobacteraceae bacterium]|nr:MltA domain-containing protein [Paracoccaceae bacterium]